MTGIITARAGAAAPGPAVASDRTVNEPDVESLSVLVCLHDLVLGGDIINAIEVAAKLRSRGHRVRMFAFDRPGGAPALELARSRSVPVTLMSSPGGWRDGPRLLADIQRLVRNEQVDVIHTYGAQREMRWAFLSGGGFAGVPVVATDYAMVLATGNPSRVPLVVGTYRLAEEARARRSGRCTVVEPPVDVTANAPEAVSGDEFRSACGAGDNEVLLVSVSRFDRYMKLPGLLAAIDAVGRWCRPEVRLALVGGGESDAELRARARDVNHRLGWRAVTVVEAMIDPRPAYAAADIVLGMGHSALRGMAFGKPLIVLGDETFSLPLTPETLPIFRFEGFYGRGVGGDFAGQLIEQLQPLVADPERRRRLGELGRQVVQEYSMDTAVDKLEAVYRAAIRDHSRAEWLADAIHLARVHVACQASSLVPRASLPWARSR